jgi:hypothetical protein
MRRVGLFVWLAAISSAAVLHPAPDYPVQIIENVQIKLTIEGRPVAVEFTRGTLGQLSSGVFQIAVEDEDEACMLAKLANPSLSCSFESPREHEQSNGFLSRNSTAQHNGPKTKADLPLPMPHTTPVQGLDQDLDAPKEDLDVVSQGPEGGSDKQKLKEQHQDKADTGRRAHDMTFFFRFNTISVTNQGSTHDTLYAPVLYTLVIHFVLHSTLPRHPYTYTLHIEPHYDVSTILRCLTSCHTSIPPIQITLCMSHINSMQHPTYL